MLNKQNGRRSGVWGRSAWVVVAIGVLIGVFFFVWSVEDVADVAERETQPPLPLVTVVEVAPSTAQAEVSVFAELRPRWNAEIRAAVSGRIVGVSDEALAGTRVGAGTALFSIEPAPYEATVTQAKMQLADARLGYLQAQNQVTVARRQFARDGVEPPNELALYLPQLRIAEQSLAAAQAQLNAAEQQLADTEVRAPFSGFVTERMASLGQTVSAGEALLHLADDRQFELVAELSQAEWALLDHPVAGGTAALFHRDGHLLAQGRIRQGGGFLDPTTRQMRVFLDVVEPEDTILSGDFLEIVFIGREFPQMLTLPETALTRSGHVWIVDDNDLLQRIEPEIVFRTGGTFTIPAPLESVPIKVAVAPLGSFLPGLRVAPHVAER